ncbi:MAG: hypothetical protein EHM20_05985 [Alphaproteobacteria bacterium]|nr:MAG: hypothetical protein EHM20_05985 [Alphaproteobacteria bacterium]
MKNLTQTVVLLFSIVLFSCSSKYSIKEPTKPWSPSDGDTETLIQKGISAYDSGNYKEAITIYQDALAKDTDCVKAMYELALTYSAVREHQKSIDMCYRAMEYQYPYLNQIYLLAGTELDALGKSKEAVEVYESAIERFSNDYMLYYNVGITYLNLKEVKKAKNAFKTALYLRPTHPSSHLALAMVFNSEGNYIPALFAYSRFLVLEPNSKRSESARESVRKILGIGASKDLTKENQINVAFNPNQPKDEGDFSSMSLFMSLNAALQMSKEQQAKSEKERLSESYNGIIGFLDETSRQEKQESFSHKYYLPYFFEMKKQNYLPTFIDHIFQFKNPDSVKTFLKWSEDFNWVTAAS